MNGRNEQAKYPMTLGQILEASGSVPTLASMLTEPQPNLSTIGREEGRQEPIGKLPSATVLDKLRNIAANVSKGLPLDDLEVEMSLVQHFGPRLVINRKTRPVYSDDGGYDAVPDGIAVSLDCLLDTEIKFVEALEYYNRPASPTQAGSCFARLRTTMLRSQESNMDIEVLIDTMIGLCSEYPADALANITKEWIRTKRFFPLPSEFIARLDETVELRRSLLNAFRTVSAKPLPYHPKETVIPRQDRARATWSAEDWQDYVREAEKMLATAKQYPAMLSVAGWEDEVKKRKAERLPIA